MNPIDPFESANLIKPINRFTTLLPGVLLCGAIGVIAWLLQKVEAHWFAHPYVESLVLAILLGTAIRTVWTPSALLRPGIAFSAKELLESAVVLLGISVDAALLVRAGPYLFAGIVAIVCISLVVSYGVGRAFGLNHRLSVLVACGNSICGNSAIAAVAPVIEAEAEDIASAIAFTAFLGLIVVLALPFLPRVLTISDSQYGIVAGLTVYAVPQVLAATLPVSVIAGNMGTLVKLTRVILLGPVVLILGLLHRRRAPDGARPRSRNLVPWFVVGFFVLAVARSIGAVPTAIVEPTRTAATVLTIGAMAALGLGVDVRVVGKVGGRVTAAVVISLALLLTMSLALARQLPSR